MKRFTYTGTYGFVIKDDKILLSPKKKGPYTGLLDLVGGGLEFGEEIEPALRREFKEEVAMEIEGIDWLDNFTHTAYTQEPNGQEVEFYHIGLVYFINHVKEIKDVKAEDEFDWYSFDKIDPKQLSPFAKKALDKIMSLSK